MWFLFMFSGEADRTPLFSQQGDLDPETSMIGKATAGVEEEVLVSLCILCNLKVTISKLFYWKSKIHIPTRAKRAVLRDMYPDH